MMLSLKALHIYTKEPLFYSTVYSSLNIEPVKTVLRFHFDVVAVPFGYLQKQTTSGFFFCCCCCLLFFFSFLVNKLGTLSDVPPPHAWRINTDKADRAKQARQTAAVNSHIDLRESSARKQMHV